MLQAQRNEDGTTSVSTLVNGRVAAFVTMYEPWQAAREAVGRTLTLRHLFPQPRSPIAPEKYERRYQAW
jgi:hypothetical protein